MRPMKWFRWTWFVLTMFLVARMLWSGTSAGTGLAVGAAIMFWAIVELTVLGIRGRRWFRSLTRRQEMA